MVSSIKETFLSQFWWTIASHPGGGGGGGVEILLVALCYGNRDKLRPDGPLGSEIDFLWC